MTGKSFHKKSDQRSFHLLDGAEVNRCGCNSFRAKGTGEIPSTEMHVFLRVCVPKKRENFETGNIAVREVKTENRFLFRG